MKKSRKKLSRVLIFITIHLINTSCLIHLTTAAFGDRIKPLQFKSSLNPDPNNPFLPASSSHTTSTHPPPLFAVTYENNNHTEGHQIFPPVAESSTTPSPPVTLPFIENASPDPEIFSKLEYPPYDPNIWKHEQNFSQDWRIPTGNPAGNALHPFEDLMNRLKLLEEGDDTDDDEDSLDSHSSTTSESSLDENPAENDPKDDSGDNNDSNGFPYPLEPPELLSSSSNDSISSLDTYSRFHYASPPLTPYVNPHHKKKVVFLSPIHSKPGHHHSPLDLHKVYSGITKKVIKVHSYDPPLYKDHRPRYKFIPGVTGLTGIKKPHHRFPSHIHITKYPSSPKLPRIHSHEYHHHPNYDAHYYGYIPGIPGKPWKDYPLFNHVPLTGFHCRLVKYPGFYADIDTGCQVWHYCQPDGRHDKFLCPNGTVFNQATRVCDWWFNVNCPASIWKYNINSDLYRRYKKVLHIHPGVKPHIHKIPFHPKYQPTGLGGLRIPGHHGAPKKHYILHKKSDGYGGYGGPHGLSKKIHKHHYMHHGPTGEKLPHHKASHGVSRTGLTHHPPAPYRPPIVVKKKPFPLPHTHKMPLADHFGNIPHHGHLILHHKIKKKRK